MPFKDREKMLEYSREYSKKHYQNNKDYYRKRNKKNKEKLYLKYKKYKETLECNICGESRWYCLIFHHINEKKMSISNMVRNNRSWKKILDEISKCIVLCKNYHAEIHHNQRIKNRNKVIRTPVSESKVRSPCLLDYIPKN